MPTQGDSGGLFEDVPTNQANVNEIIGGVSDWIYRHSEERGWGECDVVIGLLGSALEQLTRISLQRGGVDPLDVGPSTIQAHVKIAATSLLLTAGAIAKAVSPGIQVTVKEGVDDGKSQT